MSGRAKKKTMARIDTKPRFAGVRKQGDTMVVVREVTARRAGKATAKFETTRSPPPKVKTTGDWLTDEHLGDELLSAFATAVKKARAVKPR